MKDPVEVGKDSEPLGGIWQSVLDAMPGPVCVVDGEGRIIYANPAMATLCGCGVPGAILGKPGGEALESLPFEVQDSLFAALREKKKVKVTVSWEGGENEPVVLDGEAFFIPLSNAGLPPAAALTARVLPGKVPGRETMAIEASRRKGRELLSVVRHDILNQLTILIGFLQFSEDFIDDPQVREFLAKEETAGHTIQALIEFTRDFQDIMIEDPQWIPVHSLVRSATLMTDPGGVRVEAAIAPVEVFASPLLKHVFFTLIKNAIDHASGLSRITLSDKKEGPDLLLVCEDDGPGIPEAEKNVLFDRGHGRNKGYSLWLSKEILAITGATLQETGREGFGARFEIRVPEGMWRSGA